MVSFLKKFGICIFFEVIPIMILLSSFVDSYGMKLDSVVYAHPGERVNLTLYIDNPEFNCSGFNSLIMSDPGISIDVPNIRLISSDLSSVLVSPDFLQTQVIAGGLACYSTGIVLKFDGTVYWPAGMNRKALVIPVNISSNATTSDYYLNFAQSCIGSPSFLTMSDTSKTGSNSYLLNTSQTRSARIVVTAASSYKPSPLKNCKDDDTNCDNVISVREFISANKNIYLPDLTSFLETLYFFNRNGKVTNCAYTNQSMVSDAESCHSLGNCFFNSGTMQIILGRSCADISTNYSQLAGSVCGRFVISCSSMNQIECNRDICNLGCTNATGSCASMSVINSSAAPVRVFGYGATPGDGSVKHFIKEDNLIYIANEMRGVTVFNLGSNSEVFNRGLSQCTSYNDRPCCDNFLGKLACCGNASGGYIAGLTCNDSVNYLYKEKAGNKNRLFASNLRNGIFVLEDNNGNGQYQVVSTINTQPANAAMPNNLAQVNHFQREGNYLYVANDLNVLRIKYYSDGNSRKEEIINLRSQFGNSASSVEVLKDGPILYSIGSAIGLLIIDMGEYEGRPFLAGEVQVLSFANYAPTHIWKDTYSNKLYVSLINGTAPIIAVVDLSNGNSVSYINAGPRVDTFERYGDYIFAANNYDGYTILNSSGVVASRQDIKSFTQAPSGNLFNHIYYDKPSRSVYISEEVTGIYRVTGV